MSSSIFKVFYFFTKTFFHKNNIRKILPSEGFKECCILGNGPSLNLELENNISHFANRDIFVVNSFAKSDYYQILRPSFYLLIDPVYWASNISNDFQSDIMILEDIIIKTTWSINMIVPYVAYKKLSFVLRKNPLVKVYFYNHTIFSYKNSLDFILYSNHLATPLLQNVLGAGIFNAINLGYKQIELFGADHSWLYDMCVDEENRVCWVEKHFYGTVGIRPLKKANGENYLMSEILLAYSKMFFGYQKLEKYAKKKFVNVYNYTEKSFIDSFERRSLKNR